MALTLYNEVEFEYSEAFKITSLDSTQIPLNEHNLIYKTMLEVYNLCGKKPQPVHIRQRSPIPQARGLGSSSACIVAGVVGANALMESPLSTQEVVDICARLEGHPDNSTPAILGGAVACAMENGKVYYTKVDIPNTLGCCAIYTDAPLETKTARKALPKQVSMSDAVYNLSRSALLAASLLTGNYSNLKVACQDVLHQPYRIPLIDSAEKIMQCCVKAGCYTSFISGAGSAIMTLYSAEDIAFLQRLREGLSQLSAMPTLLELRVDNLGTSVAVF